MKRTDGRAGGPGLERTDRPTLLIAGHHGSDAEGVRSFSGLIRMAAPTHRHGLGPSRNCLTGETKCRPSNFDVFVCIARPRGSPPVRLPWKNVRVFASTVRKFMKLFSSSNYI